MAVRGRRRNYAEEKSSGDGEAEAYGGEKGDEKGFKGKSKTLLTYTSTERCSVAFRLLPTP